MHTPNYGALLAEKLVAVRVPHTFVQTGTDAPAFASLEAFFITTRNGKEVSKAE